MHDPWAWLRFRRVRGFRRRWDKGLDPLLTNARDLGAAHVAPDHSVGQAGLKRLVDDAATPAEIRLASRNEGFERHVLGHTAALRVEHTNHGVRVRQGLDLPNALASVAAILLQHPRAICLKARWKFSAEACDGVIAMRVGAPAEMTRSVEHLLDAHLQDDAGVCAHPWSLRRNFAK